MWVWKLRALVMGTIITILALVLMVIYTVGIGHIVLLIIGIALLLVGLLVKDKTVEKKS
jgi:hypothetical protein